MKRTGHLFDQLTSWPNLCRAAHKARRGKRFRPNVQWFEFHREWQLLQLQRELTSGSYTPSGYRTFVIYEPKRRLISAAPYRDRVVHHAVCNVLEPLFERGFISDSYACRPAKGNHAAVYRASEFAQRYRYVLKADIRKFFPSVDHQVLLAVVARRIKDPRVMDLLGKIIANTGPQDRPTLLFPGDDLFTPLERPIGLPLGNQTSQFLANVLLDPLDHFIKERLRIQGYLRYADDLLLFADDKRLLADARKRVRRFLAELRLRLHPQKCEISPTTQAVSFLGFRVFPTHRLLDKRNVLRFRRRLRRMQRDYQDRRIKATQIRQRLVSWFGHARHGNSDRLIRRLLRQHPFLRHAVRRATRATPGATAKPSASCANLSPSPD